jgi:acetate kinase
MYIWTINAGSSSLKRAIFASATAAAPRGNCVLRDKASVAPGDEARWLVDWVTSHPDHGPAAVVHRIVHGGPAHCHPEIITRSVRDDIAALSALAPLHNPIAVRWIDACQSAFGSQVPQVAVYDTGFFASLPEVAWRYAIPTPLADRNGLRRYGFHGIAHESMWTAFAARRPDLDS